MRKIYSLLLLGAFLLLGAQNLWAATRSYAGGEKLYFIGSPINSTYWESSSAKLYAYFIKNPGEEGEVNSGFKVATSLSASKNLYYVTVPDGDWTHVILTRHNPTDFSTPTWDNVWSQTGNIPLDANKNCICNFTSGSTTADWGNTYTISYKNSESWTTIKAYVWNGDNKALGDWSGRATVATGATKDATYSITFGATAKMSSVIWTDADGGEGKQSPTIDFHNGVTYTKLNGNWTYYYTLNVGSQGWASLYLPYNAKVPEDATAYFASAVTNTSVTLSSISEGNVIKYQEAVVVKADEGSYDFYMASGEDPSPVTITTNLFAGVEVATHTDASTKYVLSPASTPSGCVFGLYTGTSLGANKAYMLSSSRPAAAPAVDRIMFVIEGENNATDIKSIEANEKAVKFIENGQIFIQTDGVIYDMTGRTVK